MVDDSVHRLRKAIDIELEGNIHETEKRKNYIVPATCVAVFFTACIVFSLIKNNTYPLTNGSRKPQREEEEDSDPLWQPL